MKPIISWPSLSQSTLPMRGATIKRPQKSLKEVISIHAPHAGSDCLELQQPEIYKYFNPRSPCGERHLRPKVNLIECKFQSTLPMRGATHRGPVQLFTSGISIHAPHAGSDWHLWMSWSTSSNFNPRSPCGERPVLWLRSGGSNSFQSTLPMRGATI